MATSSRHEREPQANLILAALSSSEMKLLSPHLKPVTLSQGETLHEEGEIPQRVYFLTRGIATLSISTAKGREMGLSLVGREGIVGERAIFEGGLHMIRCSMLMDGAGFSVSPSFFKNEFRLGGEMHLLVMRTLEARLAETSQTALCNHMHVIEQRLIRWLLCLCDRLDSLDIPITQEASAQMLSMRRSGISIALGVLQDAGLLEASRGRIAIIDRRGLEKRGCECYSYIKEAVDRAYDPAPSGQAQIRPQRTAVYRKAA
jgi:CRP-like cAMP-binding protein